jgi:hypothetical protein
VFSHPLARTGSRSGEAPLGVPGAADSIGAPCGYRRLGEDAPYRARLARMPASAASAQTATIEAIAATVERTRQLTVFLWKLSG